AVFAGVKGAESSPSWRRRLPVHRLARLNTYPPNGCCWPHRKIASGASVPYGEGRGVQQRGVLHPSTARSPTNAGSRLACSTHGTHPHHPSDHFIGDLGAASTHVIRQALADHIGPGRQLLVDLSRADRVERTASALPGQCVVITGGRQLPGSVSTASTIDEARAILAAQGHPLPVVEDSERTTSELDIRTLRNRALIADALDIIQQRYDQPTAEDAFALLGQASQRHNVPVRILAAAVLRVPAPKGTTWFPGRLKAPQPPLSFPAGPAAARTVRNVLRSLLT